MRELNEKLEKNKFIKQSKGITLIALVITIIVILILAGVTIATLTGDNGLLQKAQTAQQANDQATALEKIKVEVAGSYGFDGKLDLNELNKNLAHIEGLLYNNLRIDLNDNNKRINELPTIVKLNGYNFQITNKGEVILLQTIGNITKDNYGDYIDLGQDVLGDSSSANDWRILYNDKNGHVYAILADYLPNTNAAVTAAGFTSDKRGIYSVYSTSRKNLLDRLENEEAWKTLISTALQNKGAKVKGATTVDIIMGSYNEKYGTSLAYTSNPYLYIDADSSKGIDTLYIPHPSNSEGCNGYWLASPYADDNESVWLLGYYGRVYTGIYYYADRGVCPVVSVPSDVLVTKKGDIWKVVQ